VGASLNESEFSGASFQWEPVFSGIQFLVGEPVFSGCQYVPTVKSKIFCIGLRKCGVCTGTGPAQLTPHPPDLLVWRAAGVVHQMAFVWAPVFSAIPQSDAKYLACESESEKSKLSHLKPLARRRNPFDFREGQVSVRGSFP
jgi:hypothetical protein